MQQILESLSVMESGQEIFAVKVFQLLCMSTELVDIPHVSISSLIVKLFHRQ